MMRLAAADAVLAGVAACGGGAPSRHPGHPAPRGYPRHVLPDRGFVRDFPAAARSIAAAGFRIGDHTITHPHLTQLSDAAVRHEILGGAQRIASITGKNPLPLFRFPFGDADGRTIALADQAGYVPGPVDRGHPGLARNRRAHQRCRRRVQGAGRGQARRDRAHARRLQPQRPHHVRRGRASPCDQRAARPGLLLRDPRRLTG